MAKKYLNCWLYMLLTLKMYIENKKRRSKC